MECRVPKSFYVTTPIYYVNDRPHIGHTYTTVLADVLARHHRMLGEDVFFLTGTDEHGQKIEKTAASRGITPQQLVDEVAPNFEKLWRQMGLTMDHCVRTTHASHKATVQARFTELLGKGDIYKATYKGLYSVSDEAYVTEVQAKELQAQGLAHQLVELEEESYFFRLSAYENWLIQLYERYPEFLQPEFRLNEVKQFVSPKGERGNLQDLSISRTSISWGIPVPGDEKHVVYVWFDALLNYLSACKEGHWPPTVQLVGKDILRFHAIYWPAFLMAGGFELPKKIMAHGWILKDNAKMSKSRGNVVRPEPLRQVVGTDTMRYFLMREIPFGQDGSFSYDALVTRANSDLANGLGNLASRTLTMIRQYRGGVIPASQGITEIAAEARETVTGYRENFEKFQFHRALEQLWSLIGTVDRAIVQYQPWVLAKKKDGESQARLDDILYTAAEVVRLAAALLAPVMPDSSAKIWRMLGMAGELSAVRLDTLDYGQLAGGQSIGEIEAVFPRIDAAKAVERMHELDEQEVARLDALMGRTTPPAEAPAAEWKAPEGVQPLAPTITIDDFVKIDLRVARVLAAERVEGADKLLKLTIDVAEKEPRTLVAGIAKFYEPESLVGRKVVIVANLQPRKLRGIESNGMIVAASIEGGPAVLAGFHEDIPVGARLK